MISWMVEEFGAGDALCVADRKGVEIAPAMEFLQAAEHIGEPVCLMGTTAAFGALFDELRAHRLHLSLARGSRLMDTGGAKGQRVPLRSGQVVEQAQALLGLDPALAIKPIEDTEDAPEAWLPKHSDTIPSSHGSRRPGVVLLSFGFFFELYDLLYSGYVAPGLIKSGILTPVTVGLFGIKGVASFIAALFLGLFFGTICCGFLADRFGRRAIFTYSLLLYTTANLILAFQTTATGLIFWRFVSGLGIGLEMVTIGTYISELVPKQIRGRAFACEQAVGFMAVPIVAFWSYLLVPGKPLGFDGWRWVVMIGAHGAIFVWFIRRALPESPRWLAQNGRLAEADQVMSKLELIVEREYGRPLPAPDAPELVTTGHAFRDVWVKPYGKRATMMIVFNIFQTVGFYGFANWVPTLLIKQGIPVTASLLYSSIIAVAAPIGPIIGLFIGDRFERKAVIVATAAAIVNNHHQNHQPAVL